MENACSNLNLNNILISSLRLLIVGDLPLSFNISLSLHKRLELNGQVLLVVDHGQAVLFKLLKDLLELFRI